MEQSSNGTFFAEHFCNYLDCFCASSILFTFCWFLSYCMFFPHYHCIFYHHLKSHVFPQAVVLMPRSTVWCPKDRKRFWPKRRPENHHLKLSTRNFRDVGIFPPAGDIEHCGLGLFSTAFLGCRDPWEEGAGKRKTCEKTPVRCAKDLGILDIVLISLSSWFKVLE